MGYIDAYLYTRIMFYSYVFSVKLIVITRENLMESMKDLYSLRNENIFSAMLLGS